MLPNGKKSNLKDYDPKDKGGFESHEDVEEKMGELRERVEELQTRLYAGREHAVIFLFQGMDASGKDGVVRKVFGSLNPQGMKALSFKAPTPEETSHDFLWRAHRIVPARGEIATFNRSYYEDVLITRVHDTITDKEAERRFKHINHFEELLADSGVKVVKIFINISKEFQLEKLKERLTNPDKNWKFDPNDLHEREFWGKYMKCYEDVFENCASKDAPWYVIPGDHRWYRDYAALRIVADTLEELDLHYPEPNSDQKLLLDILDSEEN
jgi:PPK2 family polyphosphate:nucleotide phosphotransferase